LLATGYEALSPWSSAFGKTHWHGDASRRVVAITFDDGPNGDVTGRILDILKRERVHATFFLVGENVRRDPATAARIAREGHVVGNHSDTHPMGFGLLPADTIRRELGRAERSIAAATGEAPRYFRPPQGIRSPWLSQALAADSLVDVTWDDAPRDWNRRTPDELVRDTIAHAHPGAIILLHDGLENATGISRDPTVEALPGIIEGLRAKGYAFVTVADLLRDEPALAAAPGSGGSSSLAAR
ncbi:MAG: polysaccharide deacetylase family protein, partial [Hyphomicrobiales bacterium]